MLKSIAAALAVTLSALGSVARLARLAHADPAKRVDNYVAAGATMGIDDGGIYIDPMVSFGHRLGGIFWLHASVSGGPNMEVDGPGKGDRLEVATGVEGRPCLLRGQLCAVFGLDLVRRDASYDDVDDYDLGGIHDFAMRERLGIDAGGRVRFRAGASIDNEATQAFDGVAIDAGIGGVW